MTCTKKAPKRLILMFGAGSQTRTGTPVKAADFESAASTNSAIPAMRA